MNIRDIEKHERETILQAASMLVEGFREHWPRAWPNLAAGRREVNAFFSPDRIIRGAFDHSGSLLGFIGGIRQYDGHVWELHPLVVQPQQRRRGIGRALVRDLERQAAKRGGLTLWLGTDDEDGMTSLADEDLFPNPLQHLARIRNLKNHPFSFYQKIGFVITGVLPDANGRGKPDIYMAKPIGLRA